MDGDPSSDVRHDCCDLHQHDLRHHGDVDAEPGLLDFAVNVRGAAPPPWLTRRLAGRLAALARYPSAAEDRAAREAVAARHGRDPDEVLLLAGAAEGFALLPRLNPRLAAVVHPSFTEPEYALRQAGVDVTRVLLAPPFSLDPALVPPRRTWWCWATRRTRPRCCTRPTRCGRFAGRDGWWWSTRRSPTRSRVSRSRWRANRFPTCWCCAASPRRSRSRVCAAATSSDRPICWRGWRHGRAHWPLSVLQLEAIAACSEPEAVAWARAQADLVAAERAQMIARLELIGVRVAQPAAGPFLLLHVDDAELVRKRLREKGIAVRRGDTFPGLGELRCGWRCARPRR